MSKFLSTRETIHRGTFAACGLCLFLLKWGVDTLIARFAFGRPWSILNYLSFVQASISSHMTATDRNFYAAMLTAAMPFIAVGVLLTMRRLASVGGPVWMAFLFFVPILNLVLFTGLCLMPTRRDDAAIGAEVEPTFESSSMEGHRRVGRRSLAVALTTVVGVVLTQFNIFALGVYGFGLFVGLPFCLGMIAAVIYGYGEAQRTRDCVWVGIASVVATAATLLFMAAEGAGCLIMAAPIWLGCSALGGFVGSVVQAKARDERDAVLIVIILTLAIPILMGAERAWTGEGSLNVVRTSVEIDAEPTEVWSHVISFPRMAAPNEWLFRTGVAFPIEATITGEGVGAERLCRFSTGDFVEPIQIWDAPRLLKFSVIQNPPPLDEWTPWGAAHPPHLDGFLVSRAGQFELTALPNGRTRLEGATWYRHNMRPTGYWSVMSDYIVGRIHMRVLQHIKRVCEEGSP